MMSLKFETTVLWICMFLIISSCSQHKNQSITKKIYKEVLKEALLYHTKNDLKLLNNSCLVLTLGAKNIDFRLDAIKNYLLNHKELISDSFEQLLINDARTYENLGLDLVKPYNLQLNSSESRRQELGNCSNDLGIITIFAIVMTAFPMYALC